MRGIVIFPHDNHYQLTIAVRVCNVCISTGCLMEKQEKNDKVSLDMTQVVSVGLMIQIARFHGQSRRCETKIPAQELWLKIGGRLMCKGEGGVWVGFYGISNEPGIVILLNVHNSHGHYA